MGDITNPFATMKKAGGDEAAEAEEVRSPEEVEPEGLASPQNEDEVPAGTAKEVMDWVGDDQDRARQALDAEEAKGDDGRKGLKRDLQGKLEN